MRLIIDANIVFASLIRNSTVRNLILNNNFELYAPEFILEEVRKHEQTIIEKSKLTKEQFELILQIIFSRIKLIPLNEFEKHMEEGKNVSPDYDDSQYFALSLHLNLMPIWSNERRLKNQDKIKVYNIQEIIEKLGE